MTDPIYTVLRWWHRNKDDLLIPLQRLLLGRQRPRKLWKRNMCVSNVLIKQVGKQLQTERSHVYMLTFYRKQSKTRPKVFPGIDTASVNKTVAVM